MNAPATPKPMYREVKPARQCADPTCGAWLTSANESEHCAQHGGWLAQRFNKSESREDMADLLVELMGA